MRLRLQKFGIRPVVEMYGRRVCIFADCCITGRRCTVEVIIVSRKVFRCFSDSALCSVSSGRTVGAPARGKYAVISISGKQTSSLNEERSFDEPGISTTRLSCRLGALLEPLITAVLKRLLLEPVGKQ